jgi:hypothetical protein
MQPARRHWIRQRLKQFGIAVVDRKKRAIVARWGLGGRFGNYPMALDDTNKRLFAGCRIPAKLVVLDTSSGRIVASLATTGDSDDISMMPAGASSISSAAKGQWTFSGNVMRIITNQTEE